MEELETQKEWYVLHTYSGYENKVKHNIESRATSMKMENNIFRVIVPEEEEREMKDGKEKITMRKTFPGYVMIEMIMSDQAWYIVRNTPGVTGFVGSHGAGSKPSPLLPEEAENIMSSVGINTKQRDIDLEIGEPVTITAGAFSGLEGTVTEKDSEKGKVTVLVEMFGRETNTVVDYDQVKKVGE